ncbi:MAG: acetyl-CoA carboxylase biotin carboxyl carrier protein, partial [Lachnospira sp.]|nr:acetyl-CoA carboxylase biotin carboxyl carrier protein [Lachnospira sp.]
EGVLTQTGSAAPVMASVPQQTVGSPVAASVVSTETAVSGNVVKSPLVGIFYSAAAPGEEPFVKVGDTVKKGQVLGIVEAMKLMNEIESDFDGVVKQILVDNEQMVEYGQSMFVIE